MKNRCMFLSMTFEHFFPLTGLVPTGALVVVTPAHALEGATRAAAPTAVSTDAAEATRPCPIAGDTSATGYEPLASRTQTSRSRHASLSRTLSASFIDSTR